MIIDSTFWVAVSFFIFIAGLVYLKVPQKVNNSIDMQIDIRNLTGKVPYEPIFYLDDEYNPEKG